MKYLLSMDGGGSKTAWLLTDLEGNTVTEYLTGGCSHPEMGVPAVLTMIHEGIQELTKRADCAKDDILAAAFGVPCYGEYPEADEVIAADLLHYLSPAKAVVCNDVELGFAGSLNLEDGIHLVAGTGAIAIGRNSTGKMARSNGWHSAFSDEGSGYWLGMRTVSLFAKQADLRVERGALYDIVRKELALEQDEDIIGYFDQNLGEDRKQLAALQLLLKKAAVAGDKSAVRLYETAAYELYLSVLGVYRALEFTEKDPVKVSYSGGLFSEGNFIFSKFAELIQQLPVKLTAPMFSPVYGGILLAKRTVEGEKTK